MTRVDLETASNEVRAFVTGLPDDPNGVELALHGHVIWRLVRPGRLSEAEKQVLLDRGRQFVRDVRERVKSKTANVIRRKIDDAVKEVRRRQRQ